MLYLALLTVGDLHIAPLTIYHVMLGYNPHLRLLARETDEAKTLGLASLDVFLDPGHEHLTKRLKVLPELLLCCLPWEAEHD